MPLNRSLRLILIGLLGFLLNQCSQGKVGDIASLKQWTDTTVTDTELNKAAKENKTYYGRQYSVITDSNVVIYSRIGNEYKSASFLLHRGDVIEQMKAANADGYFPIILADDTVQYFIKEFKGFRQFEEGMRFPVEGVVITDDAWLLTFDTVTKRFEKFEYLPPGTRYIYEITKDQHYINIWSAKMNRPVSGAFSEESMKIIQKNDHLKLMKKYKTTLERLFKES